MNIFAIRRTFSFNNRREAQHRPSPEPESDEPQRILKRAAAVVAALEIHASRASRGQLVSDCPSSPEKFNEGRIRKPATSKALKRPRVTHTSPLVHPKHPFASTMWTYRYRRFLVPIGPNASREAAHALQHAASPKRCAGGLFPTRFQLLPMPLSITLFEIIPVGEA